MRTMIRALTTAAVMAAALTACTGADQADRADYYQEMRDLHPGFAVATDSELDEIADSACRLIDTAVKSGATNEEAADMVFQSLLGLGLREDDALLGSLVLVGANCPLDISE